MTRDAGRRERKKQRTRAAIAEAALRLFERDGFAATSVQAICDEADVALSTFYAHFESKEAAAFPEDDARAEAVATALGDRPRDEPAHVTLRRATLALVDHDVRTRDGFSGRYGLAASEPALAAYVLRRQALHTRRFARLLAEQMHVDPERDARPDIAVAAIFGAMGVAWSAWVADPSRDLRALAERAHDILDAGLTASLCHDSGDIGEPIP